MNRQWIVGLPNSDEGGMCLTPGHFVAREVMVPEPGEGEIVIRAEYLSPDPMNHAWVRGMPGKFDGLAVGEVMRGGIAGRVVASRNPAWSVGDCLTGFLDWADYSVSNGIDHMGVPLARVPKGMNLASGLSALGMTGICAWIGLTQIGRPVPGDTLLISGASGGIGTIVGQLGKLFGARTVGIAGGPEKCAFTMESGFDAVVDYKAADLPGQIAAACPKGVNVFFDNVGGLLLDAALINMANYGRIVICGGTAHYGAEPTPIVNHIHLAMRSLKMEGFFYFNLQDLWAEARDRLGAWISDGQIRERFDIVEGFDCVPSVAIGQFNGGVKGRKLVRIS